MDKAMQNQMREVFAGLKQKIAALIERHWLAIKRVARALETHDRIDEANSIAQSCFPEVKRVTRTGPAPDHKPSILQDYELGRAMEIDVLVRAPAAFARAAGLSTPTLDMMAALATRQARSKGLYRG